MSVSRTPCSHPQPGLAPQAHPTNTKLFQVLPRTAAVLWDAQDIMYSCSMALQSCPIPTGLRAPPGCSDSGRKFLAPLTAATPHPQLVAGAWRKSSWSKSGVHGGLPLGTSCVCSGAECELRAGCSVCSTGHENFSVSYTRASQRQLGATLPKGHRIKCNPALGQERIALEQSWQGCLWLSDLWRFPQPTMNSWFTSHSTETAPCFHPKNYFAISSISPWEQLLE